MTGILQDWQVNRRNPKGRLVLLLFRIASSISKAPKPLKVLGYPYIIAYRVIIEWVLGVELPWHLRVGPGLRLFHGQGLVVNDKAVIGRGCTLRHSTTIGVARTALDFSGDAPVIEDEVDVGAHVVILGGVRIGCRSVIAAGSIVVSDVPPNSIVVGNPARVIKTRDDGGIP